MRKDTIMDGILETLEERFYAHMERHKDCSWEAVKKRILSDEKNLATLSHMERTGGEPDVIGFDQERGAYLYCDCSAESPSGRRSLCYDRQALEARKKNKPAGDAHTMAEEMGITILTEEEYALLQQTGDYDFKTSSWIETPVEMRRLGGGLFGDKRYGRVFYYHNGVESYYASRGFRGMLRV